MKGRPQRGRIVQQVGEKVIGGWQTEVRRREAVLRRRHREIPDYCFGLRAERLEDVVEVLVKVSKRTIVLARRVAGRREAQILRQNRDIFLFRPIH